MRFTLSVRDLDERARAMITTAAMKIIGSTIIMMMTSNMKTRRL
jgi:hypothetical protein